MEDPKEGGRTDKHAYKVTRATQVQGSRKEITPNLPLYDVYQAHRWKYNVTP
jgi:hypothetical protein